MRDQRGSGAVIVAEVDQVAERSREIEVTADARRIGSVTDQLDVGFVAHIPLCNLRWTGRR
jgi:hypothetical protein